MFQIIILIKLTPTLKFQNVYLRKTCTIYHLYDFFYGKITWGSQIGDPRISGCDEGQ